MHGSLWLAWRNLDSYIQRPTDCLQKHRAIDRRRSSFCAPAAGPSSSVPSYMAGFWGVVGKAANLFQLLGLDAITLVTVVTTCFLRLRKVTEECRKLEERVQVLAVLLLSPPGCWIMQQQNLEQLGHQVTNALRDAHDLVESYNGSTLFARVLRGRSMARRFRDLRTRIDSYCGLILSVDAFLFASQASHHPTPATDIAGVPTSSTGDSTDEESTPAAASDDDHTTHTIIDIISDDE